MWQNVGYGQFLTPGEPTFECEVAKKTDDVQRVGFWAADEYVLDKGTREVLSMPAYDLLADYPANKGGWKRLPKFPSNLTVEKLAKQGWNPRRSVILGADDPRRTDSNAEPPDVSAWQPTEEAEKPVTPTPEFELNILRRDFNNLKPSSPDWNRDMHAVVDLLIEEVMRLRARLAKLEGAGQ